MKKTFITLALAMLANQAWGLPVTPVITTPPIEKPVVQALSVDPEPTVVELEPAPAVEPFPAARLLNTVRRLQVGPQSGVTKILGNKRVVLWTRGFDDQKVARLAPEEHIKIFTALNIPETQLVSLSQQLMQEYPKLPHEQTTALLGTIAIHPVTTVQDRQVIEAWLDQLLLNEKDVLARRQALLALALLPQVSDTTIATVLDVYEHSHNLWETFPVGQFVEYHATELASRPDAEALRLRLAAVESIYTPMILQELAQQEPPQPTVVAEPRQGL